MNALARLKLIKRASPAPAVPGAWPRKLAKRVDPMAITYAARAHSVLLHMHVREPRGLAREQAIDVLQWAGQPL